MGVWVPKKMCEVGCGESDGKNGTGGGGHCSDILFVF